ncbi:hypothetical protein N5P37_007907, partial [Trichoderma harzianum]
PGGSSLLAWPARTAEARAQCATCHNPCHCGCSKLQPLHLDNLTLLSVIPYTCKLAKGEAVIENSLTALSLAASGTLSYFFAQATSNGRYDTMQNARLVGIGGDCTKEASPFTPLPLQVQVQVPGPGLGSGPGSGPKATCPASTKRKDVAIQVHDGDHQAALFPRIRHLSVYVVAQRCYCAVSPYSR